MLDLTEAIERAKLLADDSGLLSQESYDLLTSKIDDTDLYPFTMAIVNLGIRPRTGRKVEADAEASVRRFLGQAVEDEPVADTSDYDAIPGILEGAGIAISRDGKVSFYKSNIPGIYKQKLPQSLPLSTAVRLWEQQLEIADSERSRIQPLQDALARLRQQVSQRLKTKNQPTINVINTTLSDLENYGFDSRSQSQTTKDISYGIEQVFDMVMSSNWIQAIPTIDSIQETLEAYGEQQIDNYEQNLYVWDALDKLEQLQASDPELFASLVQGLGGVSAKLCAALRAQDFSQYADSYNGPEQILKFYITFGTLRELVDRYAREAGVEDLAEGIVDLVVGGGWLDTELENALRKAYNYHMPISIVYTNDTDEGIIETESSGRKPIEPMELDSSTYYELLDAFEKVLGPAIKEDTQSLREDLS